VDHDLVRRYTVYACVVGSQAYGLAGPGSDIDRRGVYLPPTPMFWRLDKPPTHVTGPAEEQFSWELERFCVLALRANPTVLECLWSPIVETVTDVGRELLALRGAFLSRRVGTTYGEYASDQFAKLSAGRRRDGSVRWKPDQHALRRPEVQAPGKPDQHALRRPEVQAPGKQALHMLRLLIAGAHVLETGEVLVDVSAHRDELLAVRAGKLSWEAVSDRAAELTARLAAARESTALPSEPDRAAVERFLVAARRGAL
jgi:predicted nucleotidyltransferase